MEQPKSLLRRFIDVRKNEVEPALLFFTFWFLLILIFQILRPLKSGLFVENLGAYWELYAKLTNIGVAILAVAGFTALYNRLGSRRLLSVLCGFFIGVLLLFAVVLRGGAPGPLANWLFYLFGDAWSTVWVTTFWAYLNEMTGTDQSKRLYGFIGGGGVVGGLVGNLLVWQLVRPLGSSAMLVGCAIATGIVGLIVWRAEALARRASAPIGRHSADISLEPEGGPKQPKTNVAAEGAKLAMRSKYLFSIVMIMFLYELVSQILDYQYKTAAQTLEGEAATQAFLGQVGTIIGVISVITQFFLVSFVIRHFGITTALLVLPVAMAAASGFYFALPILWTGALLTISDNSFNYSINQTARETLYSPTPDEVKYKARAFTNMFVQRVGKGAAILMALVLSAMPIRFLSILAFGVIAVWIYFAVRAGRRFDALGGAEPDALARTRKADAAAKA